jgi:hypothetical protein
MPALFAQKQKVISKHIVFDHPIELIPSVGKVHKALSDS